MRRLPLPIQGTGAIGAAAETDCLFVRSVLVTDPMSLRQRVVFMSGVYRGGNRYEIRFDTEFRRSVGDNLLF